MSRGREQGWRQDWQVATPDPEACAALGRALGVHRVTAQVLANRGLTDPDAARRFLRPARAELSPPQDLPDMGRAVERLLLALAGGETVCVYGDYDVDGLCSVALVLEALGALEGRAFPYIPHRLEEGYGLHAAALQEVRRRGASLVVCLDCGAAALEEAALARDFGLDLVVCDHHEVGEALPSALAVVDPKRRDVPCPPGARDLAGVGVAFKLCQALFAAAHRADLEEAAWAGLDLVALGTVADLAPLVGDNRFLVRQGLAGLASTSRPGLKALLATAGVVGRPEVHHLGFALGPRLNAAGRLGAADEALELLATGSRDRARELASILEAQNRRRQALEEALFQEAAALARQELAGPGETPRVLVLASPGWHEGIIGIVASRLVESFGRPAVLVSLGDAGMGRGSGRSLPGFNLLQALSACAPALVRFGGHALAAGLLIRSEDVPRLKAGLLEQAAGLPAAATGPALRVDAELALEELDPALVTELEELGPFGVQNPRPVLACRGVAVGDSRLMGRSGEHLRLTLGSGAGAWEAVAFGVPGDGRVPRAGERVDVAFSAVVEEWRGQPRPRLRVRGLALRGPAPAAGRLAWVDVRRLEDRVGYLVRLVAAGPVTVFCQGAPARVALAADLALRLGLSEAEAQKLLRPYPAGGRGAEDGSGPAGAPPGPAAAPAAGRVVHLVPSLEEPRFALASAVAGSGGEVHLAFGPEEVARSWEALCRRCPDREALAWVYRRLGRLLSTGQCWQGESGELWRALAGQTGAGAPGDGPPLDEVGLGVSLEILAELGLYELQVAAAVEPALRLTPLARPADKLDLLASPAFKEVEGRREAAQAFARLLVAARADDLGRRLERLLWGGERDGRDS